MKLGDTTKAGLAEFAHQELRVRLVSCSLPPGSRLNILRLQNELGVSQSALREALTRLTSEGLAVLEHNAGFRASPVLASGYRQLAEACEAIELPCLRSAIEKGDAAWEKRLLQTYRVASRTILSATAGERAIERYVVNREAFHQVLFSACDNPWMLAAWRMLYTQHMRYRQWFASLARFESRLFDDYTDFLTAISQRDQTRAVAMWRDNHRKVADFIEKINDTAGDADAGDRITDPSARHPGPA